MTSEKPTPEQDESGSSSTHTLSLGTPQPVQEASHTLSMGAPLPAQTAPQAAQTPLVEKSWDSSVSLDALSAVPSDVFRAHHAILEETEPAFDDTVPEGYKGPVAVELAPEAGALFQQQADDDLSWKIYQQERQRLLDEEKKRQRALPETGEFDVPVSDSASSSQRYLIVGLSCGIAIVLGWIVYLLLRSSG